MSNISWYVGRLRAMSLAEVGWRTGQIAQSKLERIEVTPRPADVVPIGGWESAFVDFVRGTNRPVFLDQAQAERLASEEPQLIAELLGAAREAAGHRFTFLGYQPALMPDPIDWNYDPVSEVRWPTVRASRIDYRTAVGDVKWIWELNRLQHLPLLAQAWQVTGDSAFSSAAFSQLDSWLDQNPPGQGIAWRGAFEVGVRAISVSIAMQALRHAPEMSVERYRLMLAMLAESARRCWVQRSRFSSANNHLVGELAGLATVAILFPELPQSARWERQALGALRVEADRQILHDGSGAEQAVGYQIFTAELLLTVAHLLWLRDGVASSSLMAAVKRSASFLAVVVGRDDPAPRYGDDDEGFALRLGAEPVRTVREHLAIVGAAAGSAELSRRGTRSLTARWFRQDHGSVALDRLPNSLYARDGGLVVLRSGNRRLTMDVGPLGFLRIAAHGHADALAVSLSCAGVDLVTDVGSGSYYGDPGRRRVHRGTRVHATVTVDGLDQSVMSGPFMWSRHARTAICRVDLDSGIVVAEHDGYCRLDRPVVHRRWLIAPPEDSSILVVDLLTGTGTHKATVSWPLAPMFQVAQIGSSFIAKGRPAEPTLELRYAASTTVHADQLLGEEQSRLGWWSERLEHAIPAPLLGVHADGELPIAIATLLTPGDHDVVLTDLSVELDTDWIRVHWRSGDTRRQVELPMAALSDQNFSILRTAVPPARFQSDLDTRGRS